MATYAPAATPSRASIMDFLMGMAGGPVDVPAGLGLPASAKAADELRMMTARPAIRQTQYGTVVPMSDEERVAAQGLPPNGMAYEDYAMPAAPGQQAFMEAFGGRMLNPMAMPRPAEAPPAPAQAASPGVTIPMPTQAPTPPQAPSNSAAAALPSLLRELVSPTSVTVPMPQEQPALPSPAPVPPRAPREGPAAVAAVPPGPAPRPVPSGAPAPAADPQMAMIQEAVGRMQNPTPDANGIIWNGPRQTGTSPAPTPQPAAPAPTSGGFMDDEKARNLLEFGLRLMAGGDVKPGATSGPTFAGAMGEAGLGTLSGAENRSIRRATVAREERRHQEKMGLEREGLDIKRADVEASRELKLATMAQKERADALDRDIQMMNVRMRELGLSVDRGALANSIGANRDRALKDVRENNLIDDAEKKRLEAEINGRYDSIEVQNGLRQPPKESSSAAPAPRDPKQRETGKVYTAPDGRRVQWTGQGWKLVPNG